MDITTDALTLEVIFPAAVLTRPHKLDKAIQKLLKLFSNGFVRHLSALIENRSCAGYHHPASKPWVST